VRNLFVKETSVLNSNILNKNAINYTTKKNNMKKIILLLAISMLSQDLWANEKGNDANRSTIPVYYPRTIKQKKQPKLNPQILKQLDPYWFLQNNTTSYLELAGGTMAGHINMGSWNIHNATNISANNFTGSLTGNASTASSLNFTAIASTGLDANTFSYGRASNYYGVGLMTNVPDINYGSLYNLGGYDASSLSLQLYATANHNTAAATRSIWFRMGNNLGFQNDWKEVIHSGNYNSYLSNYLPLNGGILTGGITGTTAQYIKNVYANGADDYHVELYSNNIGNAGDIALRFHQGGQWWRSIRANQYGFRFTRGNDNITVPIYAADGNFDGMVISKHATVINGTTNDVGNFSYTSFKQQNGTELGGVGDVSSGTNDIYLISANNLRLAAGNQQSMLIDNTGNVGIGTTTTSSKLSITGINNGGLPLVDLNASGTGPFQRGVRLLNNGMNVGDHIMYSVGRFDNAKNMGQTYFYYAGAGSDNNRISMGLHSVDDVFNILGTGNVGIGTTNPGAYKLAVEGTIGARKLKVTQGTWADDVFKKNYKLRSISEVEKYIQQHGHLPEVPSEKEVKGKDLDISETQTMLLRKIEELTLYVIEQNKKINYLLAENKKLKKHKK
jgi:hypothetical protein